MSAAPFQMRREAPGPDLVDALVAAGAVRVGLTGLLARRGRRAWAARVPGAAAERGFRWGLRDGLDRSWWPQGIDVAEREGRRLLAVSWYSRPRTAPTLGVRLTFVDLLRPRRPRYHHVMLAEPVRSAAGVRLDPVPVHAGGIAWLDDRILVADTFGGLREFRLDDLLRGTDGAFVLPQSARHLAHAADGDRGMRFSFVSIEHGDGPVRLVAGEYGDGSRPDRLARLTLGEPRDSVELHEPGLYRMQGVCIVDGVWYVTTSNGERTGGDLWVGAPGSFTRHRHVLPPGPEDLAYDAAAKRLWSLSEWPGRRCLFTIDPARLPG